MNRRIPTLPTLLLVAGLAAEIAFGAGPKATAVLPGNSPERSEAPAWQSPRSDEVKAQVSAWLDAQRLDPAARAKANALWADVSGRQSDDDLLARLAATYAAVNPQAAKLVERCARPRSEFAAPNEPWLREPNIPPLMANNLRLFYARWLVHEAMFDEALEQLAGLGPNDVVAPASLLFYQGVVCHELLNKDSGLKSIEELLQGAESSPKRYVAVAKLMQEDLENLQEESLDHIARRMSDVRRRLDLGRAGPKVLQVEEGVVKSLDKLIEKLEQQQQQQSASGSDNIFSTTPARDSYPLGGKGTGDVMKKNVGSSDGWGNLPPKEREQALQQIGRDFPSHYREVIEQYFRRMASEGAGE